MSKSAFVPALIVSFFVTCLASAELPFTDAVFEARGVCEEALTKGDLDAIGDAFLALLVASDPMDEERVEFADATEAELQNQLNSALELAWEDEDGRAPYLLAFWKAVAARYPEDNDIQSRYMWTAVSSRSTPWEEVQRLLIANGEMQALRIGMQRMEEDPSLVASSGPLIEALVAYVPRASPEELGQLLEEASRIDLAEVVVPVKQRFREDEAPEVREMMSSNYILRTWHGLGLPRTPSKVDTLASAYDLATLSPPERAPSKFVGEGIDEEAVWLLGDVSKKPLPESRKAGEEDPLLWERIETYEALLERYPNYAELYRAKAEALLAAGFASEAILALDEGARLGGLRDPFVLWARCWKALGGYEAQALAELNEALNQSVNEESLQLFCQLALPQILKKASYLPASWELVVAQRLELLEERLPERVDDSILDDAVSFWSTRGRIVRAEAALDRYMAQAPPAVVAADMRVSRWQARFAKELKASVFNTLPDAPEPFGKAILAATEAHDIKQVWSIYEEWLKEEPDAVAPKLYGAAAFADLEFSYLALWLISDAGALSPSVEEAKGLARVKAFASANLGEYVAAAIAQAEAADSDEPSYYWLTAFVEANQMPSYSRLSERALGALDANAPDARLTSWAWQTFVVTAPTAVVEAERLKRRESGGVPGEPEPLPLELTLDVVDSERPLQAAWCDLLLAKGELPESGWLLAAKLASLDGRADDAAFAAGRWLLGLDAQLGEQAADVKWAWERVVAYRDGGEPNEEPELALQRDPCDVSAMVRAYEDASERGDAYAAAGNLRRLWMAYGESRINLQTACEVAVAAADWELLLSVSQAALAAEPSDENRIWYHLALVASGKQASAEAMLEQVFDDSLKTVAEELSGWANFVANGPRFAPSLKNGVYADLHAGVTEAERLYFARIEAKAESAKDYDKSNAAELEAAVKQRLTSASASLRAHMRFQLGEIDVKEYEASLYEPTDRIFAQFFTIVRRWKVSRETRFEGKELADIQSILYNPGQQLYFRVMASKIMRLADKAIERAPLRASDPLVLENAPSWALLQLWKGRLGMASSSQELIKSIGGDRYYENRAWVDSLHWPPVVTRMGIAPDLPVTAMSGLTGKNFADRMRGYAEFAFKPVITRTVENLDTELASAGTDEGSRWRAYALAARRLKDLGKAFGASPKFAGAQMLETMVPYINTYPSDAFVALIDVPGLEAQSLSALSSEARQVAKLGATAFKNDYYRRLTTANGMKTGDSMAAAQKVIVDYPPGSSMYSFVKERLAAGVSPSRIPAEVENEKARRAKVAEKENRVSAAIYDFERALRSGNMRRAGFLAQQLGGQYYVRWALRDTSARMDQLVYARSLAASADDVAALTDEMNRRAKLQQEQYRYAHRWDAYGARSSGGSSWDSFKASCETRSDSVAASQRARDAKNGIRWVKVNN